MATELTVRLYFDAEPRAPEVLGALADAVTAWTPPSGLEPPDAAAPRWQGLRVLGIAGREIIHDRREDLDRDALIAAAAAFGATNQKLSTRTSVPCWRFSGNAAQAGSTMAWIDAWGDEHGRVFGEDPRRVWGSAAFTLADAGPFVAVIDREGPEVDEVNHRVEDNLEALTALVLDLAGRLAPTSIKVFTDQGAFLPFNAHLAYYRSPDALLADLRFLETVWRKGLPGHQLPPLASLEDAHSIAFHWWRDDSQRRRLWLALQQGVERAASVTTDQVTALLASGRFDSLTKGDGFAVLEYPHLLNGFVDRFFLDLLAPAAS
jgi:hypothetical protein